MLLGLKAPNACASSPSVAAPSVWAAAVVHDASLCRRLQFPSDRTPPFNGKPALLNALPTVAQLSGAGNQLWLTGAVGMWSALKRAPWLVWLPHPAQFAVMHTPPHTLVPAVAMG